MANLNAYQIALIAVLVLNLVFWALVICFRLFFDFTCCTPEHSERERRRRAARRIRRHFQDSRNSSNRSLVGIGNLEDFEPHQCPYSINGTLDAPPSYADAIKCATFQAPERSLPPFPNNFQERTPRRIPFLYEQPVTLVVPEESNSVASQSIALSSATGNGTHGINQPAFTRWSANATNFNDSSIMEESTLDSPEDNFVYDDTPITFVVNNLGTLSARMMCIKEATVDISEGKELDSHTQA